MARGGRREGAGRKPNSAGPAKAAARLIAANEATRKFIPDIDEEVMKLTPIDVMYLAMRVLVQEGDFKGAAAMAEKAAPYTHSKMPSLNVINTDVVSARELTTEELRARIAKLSVIEATIEEQDRS